MQSVPNDGILPQHNDKRVQKAADLFSGCRNHGDLTGRTQTEGFASKLCSAIGRQAQHQRHGILFFLFLTGSSGFDPCRAWSCSRSTRRCKQQLKTATHKRLKCWKWKRSRYLAKNIYAEVTQHRSCDHRKPQEIRTISQNKSKWSI